MTLNSTLQRSNYNNPFHIITTSFRNIDLLHVHLHHSPSDKLNVRGIHQIVGCVDIHGPPTIHNKKTSQPRQVTKIWCCNQQSVDNRISRCKASLSLVD